MIAHRARSVGLAGILTLGAFLLAATGCPARPVQAPAPGPGPPQVWAVLVGIERYEDEVRFPRSRGAARDAVAMARWLIEEAGWERDHVRLLIDREPSEPVPFRNPDLRPTVQRPTRRRARWRDLRLADRAGPARRRRPYFLRRAGGQPAPGPGRRGPAAARLPDPLGWRPGQGRDLVAAGRRTRRPRPTPCRDRLPARHLAGGSDPASADRRRAPRGRGRGSPPTARGHRPMAGRHRVDGGDRPDRGRDRRRARAADLRPHQGPGYARGPGPQPARLPPAAPAATVRWPARASGPSASSRRASRSGRTASD